MSNPLQNKIANTAFAFRGYNVTNLSRTPELLAHPAYGPTVRRYLQRASEQCAEITGRPVDLVGRVERREEPDLDHYAEAIALMMAVDLAQVQLLEEFHGVAYREAKMAFGYSLGELTGCRLRRRVRHGRSPERARRDGGRLRGACRQLHDGRLVLARSGDRRSGRESAVPKDYGRRCTARSACRRS